MDTLEAIFTRRSWSKVRPDPIPQDTIEKLLSAAVQAPNHFRNRPWRFIVLQGSARSRLGEIMAESLKQRSPSATNLELHQEQAKPLRAPVLIAVGAALPTEPKVIDIENVCACAAAVENMLLAAHALGLGAMWRTGPAANDPQIKVFLGLQPEQHLIGFIYLGLPEPMVNFPERPSFEDYTRWMD